MLMALEYAGYAFKLIFVQSFEGAAHVIQDLIGRLFAAVLGKLHVDSTSFGLVDVELVNVRLADKDLLLGCFCEGCLQLG